jgi:hypothetical protein
MAATSSPGLAEAIVESLMAVIVAAYDAETFVVWEPTRQQSPLSCSASVTRDSREARPR